MTANLNSTLRKQAAPAARPGPPAIGNLPLPSKLSANLVGAQQTFGFMLAELSLRFAEQLRKERQHLEGISFCQHQLSQISCKDLSKSINQLRGSWRISTSSSTNFVIVLPEFFTKDNASILAAEIVEPEMKELLKATLDQLSQE